MRDSTSQPADADAAGDPVVDGLQAYIVGGAVRDALLGLPAGDRDWVVVGATPQDMERRGFTPVGEDFPVFLHPVTHEEYALARTERKSGRGYKGFVFHAGRDVSLTDDLHRRDLTINAIAQRPDGGLVDPLGGVRDVRLRVLRHTGPAFTEDPVRLLRLARFAARFSDFTIAPDTMALCRVLVRDGEVDALVPERIWQELAKGLMTEHPWRMFDVLEECGALPRIAPELVWNASVAEGLKAAIGRGLGLSQRHALLCRASPATLQARLRAPKISRDMARLLPGLLSLPDGGGGPAEWLAQLERCDALRKPERCVELWAAAACVRKDIDPDVWGRRIQAIRSVDAGAIARSAQGDASRIREALRAARLHALEHLSGDGGAG